MQNESTNVSARLPLSELLKQLGYNATWAILITTDEQFIAHLAALPLLDYERLRERAAKGLGFRKSALDDQVKAKRSKLTQAAVPTMAKSTVVPRPLGELLEAVSSVLRRYISFPQL